jgi:hypothetical protein
MPISIGNIAKSRATVTRHFDEGSLTIEYDPNMITEDWFARLQSFSTMTEATIAENFRSFNETLLTLIKSWDLMEDDGKTVVPLTQERLSNLPIPIRYIALDMITGDFRPEQIAPQTKS